MPPGSAFPRINGGRPRVNEYLFDGISVLQPEPGQVAFFPSSTRSRSSRSKPTARPPSSDVSTAASSTSPRSRARTSCTAPRSSSCATNRSTRATLRARRRRQAGVPPPPVRRRARRADREGPDVLLRGLPGPAPDDRRVRDLDRPDAAAAPGHLHRSRSAAACRRSTIPATTQRRRRSDPIPRSDSDDSIPSAARPAARSLPAADIAGTANNYARVGNETDDQDQFDVRIDHRFATQRSRFARLRRSRPIDARDAAARRQRHHDRGDRAAATRGAFALASSYTHISRSACSTSCASATRAAPVGLRRAAHGSAAAFLPTYVDRRLPAARLAREHAPTSRTTSRRSRTRCPGTRPPHASRRARLPLVAARHRAAAVARRALHRSARCSPICLARTNTGSPLASFLLGQVQTFSIDLQHEQFATARACRSTSSRTTGGRRTADGQRRRALHAEFPVDRGGRPGAVFNLETQQLDYLGRDGHPRSARELHKNNFGPRLGLAWRSTRRTVVRSGYGAGLDRAGGHHDAVHDPQFPFLQTVTQRTLDNMTPAFMLAQGPSVAPIPLTPNAGLGQGVFGVDRDLGSGYVQQWNLSVQRELTTRHLVRDRLRRIEDHPHRRARHQHQSADGRAARARDRAAAASAESVLRNHPALVVARRPDDPASRSC